MNGAARARGRQWIDPGMRNEDRWIPASRWRIGERLLQQTAMLLRRPHQFGTIAGADPPAKSSGGPAPSPPPNPPAKRAPARSGATSRPLSAIATSISRRDPATGRRRDPGASRARARAPAGGDSVSAEALRVESHSADRLLRTAPPGPRRERVPGAARSSNSGSSPTPRRFQRQEDSTAAPVAGRACPLPPIRLRG